MNAEALCAVRSMARVAEIKFVSMKNGNPREAFSETKHIFHQKAGSLNYWCGYLLSTAYGF